jgi:hypothetical protein
VYLQGQAVTADYACADEGGGSGLASCTAPVADGAALDTSVLGKRPFTVTATDNAGNTRSVDREFKVSTRPDMAIGKDPGGPFMGDGIYGTVPSFSQTQPATVNRGQTATFFATVGNDANAPATFRLDGTPTNATGYRVQYLLGTTDITAAVDAGTYRVPNLAAGATVTITIKVKATNAAVRGSIAKVKLAAHSVAGPQAMDIARAKVTTN